MITPLTKLCFIYGLLLSVTFSSFSLANVDNIIRLQLPPQNLGQSLVNVGTKGNISIVVSSSLLRGLQAPALDGHYRVYDAIEALLNGTQLKASVIGVHVVSIVAKQDHPQKDNQSELVPDEELVIFGRKVTGSRLYSSDLLGASPVDIISAPEIANSGAQGLGEFLKFVPAVSGNSTSTAVSNGGDGTSTVTLRGLPANNTLVLINGHRTTSTGISGDATDLNSLPSAAIERIEILKDGASAIYGADAIAGVINVIMKKEFDGFQIEQYYGQSHRKDVETKNTHLIWGSSNHVSSALVSAQYYEQNGLFSLDRRLSENADARSIGGADLRSSATSNSRITLGDGRTVILKDAPGDAERPAVADFRNATDEDLYNYRTSTSSISPSKRLNIYATGNWDYADNHQVKLDASLTKTTAQITLAPTPLLAAFENLPITVSADNIYNPFDEDITDIRRRFVELPPRTQTNKTETQHYNLSFEGSLNPGSANSPNKHAVHYEVSATWNQTYASERSPHLLDVEHVQQALGSNADCAAVAGCVPLNLFGQAHSIDEQQLSFISTSASNTGKSRLSGLNMAADTTFDLPWFKDRRTKASVSIGTEFRRESIDSSPGNQRPVIGGATKGKSRGSRLVREAFFEAQIPLLRRKKGIYKLDLGIAARHSHYSDFGSTTNPKLGLRYRPTASLLLRSTLSKGFRAPTLGELHKASFQSQSFLKDPCAIEENVGRLPGCAQQSDPTRTQFLTTFGGEPNLKPEKSQSNTIGMVWTPQINELKKINNFSSSGYGNLHISLDYFKIDQRNVVDANAQFVLDQNARSNLFRDFVTRDSNGNIDQLFSPFVNIGKRKISGFDSTVRYRQPTSNAGEFIYSVNAAYLISFENQINPEADNENLAGTFTDAASEGRGALPKWKANTGIQWHYKRWHSNYSINYISSVIETIPQTETLREISRWITHDAQISYTLASTATQFSLGVDNLFDQAPPFAASAFNDNFDARTYDLKGRFWYAKLRLDF